jgi:hypothetical protein
MRNDSVEQVQHTVVATASQFRRGESLRITGVNSSAAPPVGRCLINPNTAEALDWSRCFCDDNRSMIPVARLVAAVTLAGVFCLSLLRFHHYTVLDQSNNNKIDERECVFNSYDNEMTENRRSGAAEDLSSCKRASMQTASISN